MPDNRPSLTAQRVALLRAAHQLLDSPRVFDDPLALRIIGAADAAALRSDPRQFEGHALAARVAAAGEPWKTFFDPVDLGRTLRDLGFRDIQDWSGEDLNLRYLAERSDGLRVGTLAHIVKATIRAERRAT